MKSKVFLFSFIMVCGTARINAQNVGIGTNTPATKFEVKGDAGVDLLNIKNTSGTSRLYIMENGNVGIGKTNPSTKLQVVGDVMVGLGTNAYHSTPTGEGAITLNGSTPGGMFRLVANDGSGTFNQYQNAYYDGSNWKYNYGTEATRFTSSSGTFGLYVAPSGTTGANITWKTGIYIDNAGQVGIGKISPGSALDINGTLRLSGSSSGYIAFKAAASAGSTTYTFPSSDGDAGQVLSTNGAGILSWASAGSGGSSNGLRNVRILTSGTSYTPTSGTTKIRLVMVGGGGAGGGAAACNNNNYSSVGSGGGSGGYLEGYITLGTGTYTIAIGAGGTGNSGAAGGDGGNTTFKNGTTGETYTAYGGKGGATSAASGDREDILGGDGGITSTVSTGSPALIYGAGNPGGYGWQRQSSEQTYSGAGGASIYGGAGKSVIHNDTDFTSGNVSLAGKSATGYGSGGGGAATKRESSSNAAARAGGNGSGGIIVIYEY